MKKYLLFSTLILVVLGYLFLSLIMYQRLVSEGSELADKQCLTVNPIIIERKNNYLKSVQAVKDNDLGAYEAETENYFESSQKYVEEQTKWIEAQRAYMDRWDFRLFLPGYMKQAAQYQYDSRKADIESTRLLIDAFEASELNQAISEELGQKSVEQVQIRNEAEKRYNDLWEKPMKLDWRTKFIKVPESKCPEENLYYPQVEDVFTPSIEDTDTPIS